MSCGVCDRANAYLNNDGKILVTGLQDNDGNSVVGATITYQIYDNEYTAISGANGSLTNTAGGSYSTDVDKDIINLLSRGQEYEIRLTGVKNTTDFEFNIPILVNRRGNI